MFGSPRRGISAAALEGATTEDLCREAFLTIERRLRYQQHEVDRFAVWLSSSGDFKELEHRYAYVLNGERDDVQDRAADWDFYGLPALVPPEILDGQLFHAQEHESPELLSRSSSNALRSSLWVPIRRAGEVTGVLVAASREKAARFPLGELKRVAAELSLALAARADAGLSRSLAAELAEARTALAELAAGAPVEQFLQAIADGSLRAAGRDRGAPDFVMIGMRSRASGSDPGHPSLEFRWIAGDKIRARAAMAEPAAEVWRNAMKSRAVKGEAFRERSAGGHPSRLIAIPILHGKEAAAVLVAGVAEATSSLALLERLELRARLAGAALHAEPLPAADALGTAELQKLERLASLGQNVSAVAHELSNPLTTILGYAQRLLRHPAIEHRDDLLRIFSEADRASSILRQLLLSVRDTPAERPSADLNQLICDAVETERHLIAGSAVRLELDLLAKLPPVAVEQGQLRQILGNLLSNARQALSEQGAGGTIFVRTRMDRAAHPVLEVADTGPGIPESLRMRIFDPFVTTKPAGVGTGLGLSIVKSLVVQNDGTIEVQSEPGRGATFVVTFLPASNTKPSTLPERAPTFSAQAASPVGRGGEILVIEDEPTVAQLIADILSDLGYSVLVMSDARRALAAALNRDFALVVCDMKMPGLDGRHVYRALLDARSPLVRRFLFVTGDVLGQSTREFLRVHRLPHVAKPFRLEEFSNKVQLALRQAGSEPATAAAEPAKSTRKIGQG